jgi:hypothetical protein
MAAGVEGVGEYDHCPVCDLLVEMAGRGQEMHLQAAEQALTPHVLLPC